MFHQIPILLLGPECHQGPLRLQERWTHFDGFLPFRDNVEYAAAAGVTTIVEPGGSARTGEVAASALAHGIAHVQTGLRLFHH